MEQSLTLRTVCYSRDAATDDNAQLGRQYHSTTIQRQFESVKAYNEAYRFFHQLCAKEFHYKLYRPRVHASRELLSVLVFRPDMSEITRDEVYPNVLSRRRPSFLPFQEKKLSYSLPEKRVIRRLSMAAKNLPNVSGK